MNTFGLNKRNISTFGLGGFGEIIKIIYDEIIRKMYNNVVVNRLIRKEVKY